MREVDVTWTMDDCDCVTAVGTPVPDALMAEGPDD
jgi:hypothetical protein